MLVLFKEWWMLDFVVDYCVIIDVVKFYDGEVVVVVGMKYLLCLDEMIEWIIVFNVNYFDNFEI